MELELQILFDNYDCKESTFIYALYEEAIFKEDAFWDYYNSIITITEFTKEKPLDRKISTAISWTHSFIVECFLWHLSKKDVYHMENYPAKNLALFMERLRFMIDGYFKGYIINEEDIEVNEISNPKYKGLSLNS